MEIKEMTSKEKKFVKKAEAAGYKVRSYSGRFMYGRTCPAVSCKSLNDCLAEIGMKGLKVDNLGLGYIVYTG